MGSYITYNRGGIDAVAMKNKEVILSGTLTGISGLFARIAMINTGPGFAFVYSFLFNPFLWLSSAFGMLGFAYLQLALHKQDISFVEPAVSSIAIITPVVLAVVILNEYVPVLRWIGVGLLLLGVIGIHRGEKKSLLAILTEKFH